MQFEPETFWVDGNIAFNFIFYLFYQRDFSPSRWMPRFKLKKYARSLVPIGSAKLQTVLIPLFLI